MAILSSIYDFGLQIDLAIYNHLHSKHAPVPRRRHAYGLVLNEIAIFMVTARGLDGLTT